MVMFPKPKKVKKVSKQEHWYNVMHNEILPQFEKWGITTCEIKSEKCTNTTYLGFAHTKKRRDITTPEQLRRVVLACQPCHEVVEYHCKNVFGMTMEAFLEIIIKNRQEYLKTRGFTF